MPTSFNSSTHLAGLCWMLTPSASRQSAVPHCEEAARLPCLATFMPPAAATRAEVVEILKLWALPPVPTIVFLNSAGLAVHRAATGPEIWKGTDSKVVAVESAGGRA